MFFFLLFSCTTDIPLEKPTADIPNVANLGGGEVDSVSVYDNGLLVESYIIDENGMSSVQSTNIETRAEVIKGTVFQIDEHSNGNRHIKCTKSEATCYTVGVGPGPCASC